MKKDYISITILTILLAIILGINIYNGVKKEPKEPVHQNNNINHHIDINKYNVEEDIKKDDKINIYFFWRKGCEHCKAQFAYLEENFYKYQDKCNIYSFEIMDNEDNQILMDKFSNALGENIDAVPFTIVGNNFLLGYSYASKEDLEKLIEDEINNKNYEDLYFEKIINSNNY